MSFLQKFFAPNVHNKTENELKVDCDHLKSSNLCISKDQIRFLLFRECDRRGRKLLFDSNAVEKVPLQPKEINLNKKCPLAGSKKNSDYIETTATHGYRYKKLPDDVACYGEMIFGSVAMTYKGENSCKIHKIPTPKKLMFTTIIHSPVRCHIGAISECSSESSSTSIKDSLNQKETSSSDSKLYKSRAAVHKCSSTYPCTKNAAGLDNLVQCCEAGDVVENLKKNFNLPKNNRLGYSEGLTVINDKNEYIFSKETKVNSDLEQDFLILNYSHKISGCEQNSGGNANSATSMVSSDSENVSSISGSLSSLRRRWTQSNSTSLNMTSQEDVSSTPCKKRTKLGLSLVLHLCDSKDDEVEIFLFNHTITIDSIMNKLQSAVESAYIKNQNFVDLLYTAFLDTQQSIYDLVTSEKYSVPLWIGLLGDSDDSDVENNENNREDSFNRSRNAGLDFKFSLKQLSSPIKLKKPSSNEHGSLNNAKVKFLNDFQDVLVRFDTKDTNFFISTLLTAVLTHHLSWVTAIAETDTSNRHEKVRSVIKNYNPIWAQLNDLCGLLGSPLTCTKTIVKGNENKKSYITSIIQVLTYFIRCFNVVENVFDVNIEDVIGEVENSAEVVNFLGSFHSTDMVEKNLKEESSELHSTLCAQEIKSEVKYMRSNTYEHLNMQSGNNAGRSLRRNKISSIQLNLVKEMNQVYTDNNKKDLIKGDADLKFRKVRDTNVGEFGLTNGDGQNINCHIGGSMEGYMSPDEGYDTIDSTKKDSLCSREVDGKIQKSNYDIVFLLGEDEKLVNLRKKVVKTKSGTIEFENEELEAEETVENSTDLKNAYRKRIENQCEKLCRTFDESVQIGGDYDDRNSNVRCPSMDFLEINMPQKTVSSHKKHLDVSSVFGGVNHKYNSEQIIQGLIDSGDQWEETLQKDLHLCAYNSIVEKNVSEALCIIGDVDSWEVSIRSSSTSLLERKRSTGVRVCMSQLVADMLESFLIIHKINLSPNFCLFHIEKKLREIYLKSKTVAELLISTDLCTVEYLTTKLDIGINDIPLLLSVATTHSPQISEKYGLSFT